jgi:hypothetical protein
MNSCSLIYCQPYDKQIHMAIAYIELSIIKDITRKPYDTALATYYIPMSRQKAYVVKYITVYRLYEISLQLIVTCESI